MLLQAETSFLGAYIAAAESGDVVIGYELYQELCNLREDVISERYIYNPQKAKLRIKFMQDCVLGTKSPFTGKKIDWMLWELAYIETLYSFQMPDTGFDRFQKSLLLVARKNGKSAIVSGLGLSELFIGPPGADICCSSNDDAQSSLVYDVINDARVQIDPNDRDSHKNQRFIINDATNSHIFKISVKTKNKEGRNIDFGVVDEAHEMLDNTIPKSIEQSQSIKDNPKLIIITTEGFVYEGYLDAELKKARQIIKKEYDGLDAERYLPWLYTQDSEQEIWTGNEQNRLWEKSNPSLGSVKKYSYLAQQVDSARASNADRIFVFTKDFNIKQNSVQSWLKIDDYTYDSTYDIETLRGSAAIGAVDLAETTDLCNAKILIMKANDEKKYVISHYFICESKLREADDADVGAKYSEWAEQGWITICTGNEVDLDMVADWFYSLYTDYDIKLWKFGYDQRFAKAWISKMEYYGWAKDSDLEMILQNSETLNNAIRLCERDLQHRLIQFNNNPVDTWCLSNAALKVDSQRRALIVKQADNRKRIDGAVTLAILYETYRRYKSEISRLAK